MVKKLVKGLEELKKSGKAPDEIDMKEVKKMEEDELREFFLSTVENMEEDDIPENIADLYNELVTEEEEKEKSAEVEEDVEEEEEEKVEKKTKKAPPAKEEKKTPAKTKPTPSPSKAPEKKPVAKKKEKASVQKSCFGHKMGSQSALIDAELKKGGTFDGIAKKLGLKKARVEGHYKHLVNDKGIKFDIKGDKYTAKA